MTRLNEPELRDATVRAGVQGVTPYEERYTEPEAWLESLRRDLAAGAVDDQVVLLARVSGPATMEQAVGRWTPGPDRPAPLWASKYATASYVRRGRVVLLSTYCGVVWRAKSPPGAAGATTTRETAERLSHATNLLQRGLAALEGLDVREGGALYVNAQDEQWLAHYMQAIEPAAALVCRECGVALHYANNAWRGPDGRAETWKDGTGRDGRPIKALDHEHQPAEAGA